MGVEAYGESAWSGKPAAIMGTSIGAIGSANAQYHLRQMMVFLNMFPINQPEVMIGNAVDASMQTVITDDTPKSIFESYFRRLWSGLREFRSLRLDKCDARCLDRAGN